MIPLDQTQFSNADEKLKGNCLQTCFASIFELPLEEVPHFASFGSEWGEKLFEWCDAWGIWPIWVNKSQEKFKSVTGYTIGCGPGPRGFQHAIVCMDGKMIHDPHPSRAGLIEITDHITFVLREPAKLKKR